MNNKHILIIITIVSILVGMVSVNLVAAQQNTMTDEELEKWFNSDKETVDPIKLINEGKLVFLSKPPERKPHQTKHDITILPTSLTNGWVKLYQCHKNLDVMPAAQVVFINKRVRKIKIISSNNINKVWIENDTVQLKTINKNAALCIELETKALWNNSDGSYSLRTGPYQRRFLDGYFPVRLNVNVTLPENMLMYKNIMPSVQPGLSVVDNNSNINVDALFEGKLNLVINFDKK